MTDYDAWILRGPEGHLSEIMEACEACKGTGGYPDECGEYDCEECGGIGEIAVTLDEPDADYLYGRKRDAGLDAK